MLFLSERAAAFVNYPILLRITLPIAHLIVGIAMTSRTMLFVAASLWSALTLLNPVSAQEGVPLRASHQGQFLPDGTQIIVLSKDARVQRDGRYQPEFLPISDFPRGGFGPTEKDRLGTNGRSEDGYDKTQPTGRLYFIYALAPDSTLYWSYSAQRDSLKYDVVSSGVMSVAPIVAEDVRDDVLESFFNRRVRVFMPADTKSGDDRNEDGEYADARDDRKGRDERGEESGDSHDEVAGIDRTGEPLDDRAQEAGSGQEAADREAKTPATRLQADGKLTADGMPAGSRSAESTGISIVQDSTAAPRIQSLAASTPRGLATEEAGAMQPFLAYKILLLLVAAAAVPAFMARNYRLELKQVRREMLALRNRAAGETIGGQLHEQIKAAESRCKEIEEDYHNLLVRYRALEREIDAQQV
jgi:hypothetical protein